jgi:hypothetical protein
LQKQKFNSKNEGMEKMKNERCCIMAKHSHFTAGENFIYTCATEGTQNFII